MATFSDKLRGFLPSALTGLPVPEAKESSFDEWHVAVAEAEALRLAKAQAAMEPANSAQKAPSAGGQVRDRGPSGDHPDAWSPTVDTPTDL